MSPRTTPLPQRRGEPLYSILGALSCALILAGCATSSPADIRAASLTYALPETRLLIGLDLVLTGCSGQYFQFEPTLTLAAQAVAGSQRHTVSAAALSSFSQKRDVGIQLYDNGTLKSVSASASDRSLAIVANTFKLTTWLVGSAGLAATDVVVPGCNQATERATSRLRDLERLRAALQQHLVGSKDPEVIHHARVAIDAVAGEIADLRSGPLRLELKATVSPPARDNLLQDGQAPSVEVVWQDAEFIKWVALEHTGATARRFGLNISLWAISSSGDKLDKAHAISPDESAPECGRRPCPYLLLRSPVMANVEVRPTLPDLWRSVPATKGALGEARVPIAQWGNLTNLPLSAAFGDSRALKMELDPYGRVVALGIVSEARGEVLTAGLIATSDAGTALKATLARPTEFQQQVAKIAELEALQKYNKLIKCEEVLKAGGYTCPD